MSEDLRIAYLKGQYEMCGLLLTSPVFGPNQRKVITHRALAIKDALEDSGVKFLDEVAV